MGKSLIKFLLNIAIIVIGVLIVLGTSTLLELHFFKEMIVRELVIYFLMVVQLFITFRIVYLLNRNESWMKNNTR